MDRAETVCGGICVRMDSCIHADSCATLVWSFMMTSCVTGRLASSVPVPSSASSSSSSLRLGAADVVASSTEGKSDGPVLGEVDAAEACE